MLDLLKQLLATVDWNTVTNILIAAIAAWLGIPLAVKEPGKLPVIGRLFGGKAGDDVEAGFNALRELDGIHERAGIDVETRRKLFVEGV